MLDNDYATKGDIANLRAELFGNIPPKFENDVGRIGKMEQAVAAFPTVVKNEIKAMFSSWKAVTLFIISLATFSIMVYTVMNK